MLAKVPVFSIVFGAYAAVFRNLTAFIQAWFLPGLGMVVLGAIRSPLQNNFLLELFYWLIGLPLLTLVGVACHRIVLLGRDSLTNPWSLYWSKRESSFLTWLLILGVFFYGATQLLGVLFLMSPDSVLGFKTPYLGVFLTYVSVAYLEGRFSMVLPATALDKRFILSNSWRLTAGNGLRIAIAILIPVAVLLILMMYGGALMSLLPVIVMTTVLVFLLFVTVAVEIAVLSKSYRFLTDSADRADVDF